MTEDEKKAKELECYHRVMGLSDLQICQYIADIEGLTTQNHSDGFIVIEADEQHREFNPLENEG